METIALFKPTRLIYCRKDRESGIGGRSRLARYDRTNAERVHSNRRTGWRVVHSLLCRGAGSKRSRQDPEECLANLREAIALILEQRREDTLRSMPADAKQELVVLG